jgi:hypothetical protein
VLQNRPENWNLGVRFLHYDKALAQSDSPVQEFLAKNNMRVIPHSTYTLDLVPCDIFLFLKLNMALKRRKFNDVTMIKVKSRDALFEFQTINFRKFRSVVRLLGSLYKVLR